MSRFLFIVSAVVLAFFVGKFFGANEIVIPEEPSDKLFYALSYEERWKYERDYASALLDGLRYFYVNDHRFFAESFMDSEEYSQIEIANQGDWEDFFRE